MPESSESEVLGVETSCLYPHQDRLPQAAITCEIVLERTLCELVAAAPHYNLCVSWSLCELVAAAPHSNFCVSWSQPSIITVDCLCELVAAPVVPAPHDRVSVDRVSSKRHFGGSSWYDRVYLFLKCPSGWVGKDILEAISTLSNIRHPSHSLDDRYDDASSYPHQTLANSSFAPVQ